VHDEDQNCADGDEKGFENRLAEKTWILGRGAVHLLCKDELMANSNDDRNDNNQNKPDAVPQVAGRPPQEAQ
jgi:hypothetical protein